MRRAFATLMDGQRECLYAIDTKIPLITTELQKAETNQFVPVNPIRYDELTMNPDNKYDVIIAKKAFSARNNSSGVCSGHVKLYKSGIRSVGVIWWSNPEMGVYGC